MNNIIKNINHFLQSTPKSEKSGIIVQGQCKYSGIIMYKVSVKSDNLVQG